MGPTSAHQPQRPNLPLSPGRTQDQETEFLELMGLGPLTQTHSAQEPQPAARSKLTDIGAGQFPFTDGLYRHLSISARTIPHQVLNYDRGSSTWPGHCPLQGLPSPAAWGAPRSMYVDEQARRMHLDRVHRCRHATHICTESCAPIQACWHAGPWECACVRSTERQTVGNEW